MVLKKGAISQRASYPRSVAFALVAGVLIPSACVIWFMTEAVRNEHLAVQQRLMHVYREQLDKVKKQMLLRWRTRVALVTEIAAQHSAAQAFAEVVNRDLASSVVFCCAAERRGYPAAQFSVTGAPLLSKAWRTARRLEHQKLNFSGAVVVYGQIAERAADLSEVAQALKAQARCLFKAGRTGAALDILTVALAEERFRNTKDWRGRLIQPGALLYALQIMAQSPYPGNVAAMEAITQQLTELLSDYVELSFPAQQRAFLMRQLQTLLSDTELSAGDERFPTLTAEELALAYLESHPLPQSSGVEAQLRETAIPDTWALTFHDQNLTLLFTRAHIAGDIERWGLDHMLPEGTEVRLFPALSDQDATPLLTLSTGEYLAGWQLSLTLKDASWLSAAAESRIVAYLWAGILIIAAIILLAVLTARYVGRQLTLNRLENDLVANVSHELKTPLSSIRVLAETLLNSANLSERKTREYLQIIAKENLRLSRLIDNFLDLSRFETQQQAVTFARVSIGSVIDSALEVMGEMFNTAKFALEVEVYPDLPTIRGDADLLVTVLVNLLDNAYKYSGDSKKIAIRAYQRRRVICIEVQDFGIGMTSRQLPKIFHRFYRADSRLTRSVDGCGLGLNVVEHIVKAHNGSITVTSRPARGSIFKVSLPI
ncbi:HAMP domain-containing histidine kinase [Exilibacterium tricleocarpae]|uniref:histidine kinase n=1 Tax=Exilibacterium tricleocarpae TaxID=2591008 RepID=A0A545T656_9GAMM|nr:HAMP domain-containing sensor histidine kinase [Exilibacterium tricleocarpae]TQV72710.1 HAMP domain-containing histidine kinase [Exilibacterium tricleocarpae]